MSGGVCETGGVGEGVGWEPFAVAEAAIDPRSEDARGEGVVAPDGGGVGSADVDALWALVAGCSEGVVRLNMASIWGFIDCPNGVERNSAGKPVARSNHQSQVTRWHTSRLTAYPTWNLGACQKANHVCGEVVTVELYEVILVRGVHLLQTREIFLECRFVNLCIPAIYHLNRLTMVRLSRYRLEDALSEKDLPFVCDDRGVPEP